MKKLFAYLHRLFYEIYLRTGNRNEKGVTYKAVISLSLETAAYCYGDSVPCYIDGDGDPVVEEKANSLLNWNDFKVLRATTTIQDGKFAAIYKSILDSEIQLRSRVLLANFFTKSDRYLWKNRLAGSSVIYPKNLSSWGTNEELREWLTQRTQFLPRPGILLEIRHITALKSVFLREKIYKGGNVVVLFSVKNQTDEHMEGFFDNMHQTFFSCITDRVPVNNRGEEMELPFDMENFILQIYAQLTTQFAPQRNRLRAIKIVKNEAEYNFVYSKLLKMLEAVYAIT